MRRDLLTNLQEWAEKERPKPIILRGPRQAGKSWLAQEIGKKFENFVEINFEMMPEIGNFFKTSLDPQVLTKNIANYLKIKITPGRTLLFFDEIQQVPEAVTALRYFYEKLPTLHVIAAGSLLEFELKNISIPVGRVSFLYVYPLSFAEYLTAKGNDSLRTMLRENDKATLHETFHLQLLQEVRDYTLIGGMPEVVKEYISTADLAECINIQSDILQTYIADFHKYAKKNQIKYLAKTFNAIPHQLGRKFKYSNIDKNIKSTVLGEALDLLEMAGVIYKVYHTSANGIPLGAEINPAKFKVLFFDIGLTQRILNLDYSQFLLDSDISQINNGTIAELFVGLELIAHTNPREKCSAYYWHREKRASNAEIDYIILLKNRIVPVEVKSGATGSMKSLKIFMESKSTPSGLKISSFPYSHNDNIISVPFYGIEQLIKKPVTHIVSS